MDNDAIILAKIASSVNRNDISTKKEIVNHLVDLHNWNKSDAIRVVLRQIPLYYLTYSEFVTFMDSVFCVTGFNISNYPDRFIFANTSIMSAPSIIIRTINNVEQLSDGQYCTIMDAGHIAQLNNEGFVVNNIDPNHMDMPGSYLAQLSTKRCNIVDVRKNISDILNNNIDIDRIVWKVVRGISYDDGKKQLTLSDDCLIISDTPVYDIAICDVYSNAEYRKKLVGCKFPVILKEGV